MRQTYDDPPAALDRFGRCCAKFITHRAEEIRATSPLEHRLAGALARYWQKEAQKAGER